MKASLFFFNRKSLSKYRKSNKNKMAAVKGLQIFKITDSRVLNKLYKSLCILFQTLQSIIQFTFLVTC